MGPNTKKKFERIGGIHLRWGVDDTFITYATLANLDDLVKIEKEAWIPGMQASRKTLSKRIQTYEYGNLIAYFNGAPVGILNARIGSIEKCTFGTEGFKEFSSMDLHEGSGDDFFIFNVGVKPKFRDMGIGSGLVIFAEYTAIVSGLQNVYLDARCPSYNGSTSFPQENVPHRPKVKESIDSGILDEKILAKDPVQYFYQRLGYGIYQFAQDYIPGDFTCPHRIIRHKDLRQFYGKQQDINQKVEEYLSRIINEVPPEKSIELK